MLQVWLIGIAAILFWRGDIIARNRISYVNRNAREAAYALVILGYVLVVLSVVLVFVNGGTTG